MEETEAEIPNYLDQDLILIWEPDELVVLAIVMFGAMMMGQPLLGVVLGYMASLVFQRFKIAKPAGLMMHMVYWSGVMPGVGPLKNGQDREWIGG